MMPLPTARGSLDASGRAVDMSAYFTRSGVIAGLAASISATTPEVTAVDIDVPLPARYGGAIDGGNIVVIAAPGAASDTRWAPGATTSGFARPSAAVGPWALKLGR